MTAPLLSVGPSDAADDERVIAKGYQLWKAPILAAVPVATAYFADIKWVIAISAALLIAEAHKAGGRLHDLCIRHRRTNLILSQTQSRS